MCKYIFCASRHTSSWRRRNNTDKVEPFKWAKWQTIRHTTTDCSNNRGKCSPKLPNHTSLAFSHFDICAVIVAHLSNFSAIVCRLLWCARLYLCVHSFLFAPYFGSFLLIVSSTVHRTPLAECHYLGLSLSPRVDCGWSVAATKYTANKRQLLWPHTFAQSQTRLQPMAHMKWSWACAECGQIKMYCHQWPLPCRCYFGRAVVAAFCSWSEIKNVLYISLFHVDCMKFQSVDMPAVISFHINYVFSVFSVFSVSHDNRHHTVPEMLMLTFCPPPSPTKLTPSPRPAPAAHQLFIHASNFHVPINSIEQFFSATHACIYDTQPQQRDVYTHFRINITCQTFHEFECDTHIASVRETETAR